MRPKIRVFGLIPWLKTATEGIILLVLFLALLVGCGGKVITISFSHKTLSKIHISGQIKWRGKLDSEILRVRAKPVPVTPATVGAEAKLKVFPTMQKGQSSTLDYRFDLPVVSQVKATRAVRNRWRIAIGKPAVRYETVTVKYYIIRVQPPSGWKAEPSEYKVSNDTKTANFILERMSKQIR